MNKIVPDILFNLYIEPDIFLCYNTYKVNWLTLIKGAAAAVPTPTEKGVLIMDFDFNLILSIIILIILADIIKNIKK